MYLGKVETGRSYKKIIALFIILSIVLIGFVVYNSFSKAKITITPKHEIEEVIFEMPVGNVENEEQAKQLSLPGRVITKTSELNETYNGLEDKLVDSHARGKVTVHNNLDATQALVPKTQLKSEKTGLIFRTDSYTGIPAHGQIEVSVTADDKGEKTNIDPDKFIIIKVRPDWQDNLYAESKSKMEGGKKKGKIATEEEIEKAKNQIAANAHKINLESLKSELKGNEKILEQATKIEILNFKPQVSLDQEVASFGTYVQIKSIAVIFDEKKLFDQAQSRLQSNVTDSKEYLGHIPESFKYEVTHYDENKNYAKIKVTLQGNIIYKLATEDFDKNKLIGRTREETVQYFEKDGNIENIDVKFSPFWVQSIPNIQDKIEIIVNK
jgi:hypothetical protein